jgi:hypothetical protein
MGSNWTLLTSSPVRGVSSFIRLVDVFYGVSWHPSELWIQGGLGKSEGRLNKLGAPGPPTDGSFNSKEKPNSPENMCFGNSERISGMAPRLLRFSSPCGQRADPATSARMGESVVGSRDGAIDQGMGCLGEVFCECRQGRCGRCRERIRPRRAGSDKTCDNPINNHDSRCGSASLRSTVAVDLVGWLVPIAWVIGLILGLLLTLIAQWGVSRFIAAHPRS